MDGCLQSDGRYNEYVIGWRGREVGGCWWAAVSVFPG
jgi:hypothetical protein